MEILLTVKANKTEQNTKQKNNPKTFYDFIPCERLLRIHIWNWYWGWWCQWRSLLVQKKLKFLMDLALEILTISKDMREETIQLKNNRA